ncbi:MAG: pirin family protein [Proteobacteria bacterium]|nr:pirin family protein [Pseudomonadota bacterium]
MSPILDAFRLGFPWKTLDPFLFCAYHKDDYPQGNDVMGPDPSTLAGRNIGSDFVIKDGWRMYHGDVVPGFPQHPHRGFETVTLARSGFIDHSDSLGATARFGHGDIQWMTAGSGIVHSEMFPLINREQGNPSELFQLWLNLPAKDKMVDPAFKMLWAENQPVIQVIDESGPTTEVLVAAGELSGKRGDTPPPNSWAANPENEVAIWTLRMEPGATFTIPAASAGLNRVLYFFRGSALFVADKKCPVDVGVQLKSDAAVKLVNGSETAELLFLQGKPIGEPVAHHGPMVMNTNSELQQAFADYRRTRFGGWPWERNDPVHAREEGRFAIHADGRLDRPDEGS